MSREAPAIVDHFYEVLLGLLTEKAAASQSGRGALTRPLGRRQHLPTVVHQEVTQSRRTVRPFAVVMADIDPAERDGL